MWKSRSRPSYSAMRMKLGELIVALTPSPRPKPFANTVLPAPRSPQRQIRSPATATAARRSPSAKVASGESLVRLRAWPDVWLAGSVEPRAEREGATGSGEPLEVAQGHRDRRSIPEPHEPCLEDDAPTEAARAGKAGPAALGADERTGANPD